MERLIEIKNVPIELEMKVNHARLEYKRSQVDLEISRSEGGLQIRSKPIRLNLDTFEARNSITPTAMRSIEQAAQKGREQVYETTGTYARHGKLLLQAKIGEQLITQFAMESQQVNTDVAMTFLPSTGPDISWEPADLSIDFAPAQLAFDPQVQEPAARYVPGELSVNVEQYPKVEIEYMGDPIYVPPSANPAGNEGPQ